MTEEVIRWDLSGFYSSINDSKIENDMQQIEKEADEFNRKVKGKLSDPSLPPAQLVEWFKAYESIKEKLFYLKLYSQLIYLINSLDDDIKSFNAKINEFNTKIERNILFFYLELNIISDDKFNELIKAPELTNYSHELKFNRLKKIHQLSEKEEQITLMKDFTGVNGFIKLYGELKSSFIFDFEVEGEMKKLTEAELFSFMYQSNRDLRLKALRTMMQEYEKYKMIFTHIFNNVLKNWDLESKEKKYDNPISARNLENEVSAKSVEAIGEVTTESYPIVEKYYNLKKKILNLEELHMSDLYAPIGQTLKEYTYEEALELIKTADEKFHPEFRDIMEKMNELGHIDVTHRKGKNRGAFCAHGKMNHYPFVFVNFTGNVDSVRTLAHEFGHAFQAYYIQKTQNFINVDISLVVAEIASVFNEILTFDYLMNTDLSKEEKISLLCGFIESKFATSHRQNAFYRFEKRMHDLLEKKLPSTNDIRGAFVEEMELMFRNSMTNIKEEYQNYVFVVSHFL